MSMASIGFRERRLERRLGLWILSCVWMGVFAGPAAAADLYVATNGTDQGTRDRWSYAYTNVQDALSAAADGDAIYLAGHTFRVPTNLLWTGRQNVLIQGGYEATSDVGLPGPSDTARWPTILTRTGGNVRILYASGITNGVLRNVTLREGYYTSATAGIGLYATKCAGLTLDSCVIVSNIIQSTGSSAGAGLLLDASTVLITNCLIVSNAVSGVPNAWGYGGGVYVNSGTATISQCRLIGNRASGANYYSGYGGGVYVKSGAAATIRQSVISRNTASSGATYDASQGGGVWNGGTLTLENCLVDKNNSSKDVADGIYAGGVMRILSCTVVDNAGVGIHYAGSSVVVSNSIVWGHSDDLKSFPTDGQTPPTLTNVFYSCIEDGDNAGRQGCVSITPQFVDTNGYHLSSRQGFYTNGYFSDGGWSTWSSSATNSPLIDAGDPSADASLEPTPNGGRLNLGAYGNTPVASLTDTTTVYTVASVINRGAMAVGHRTLRVSGEVTDSGGDTPECWARYWIAGSASTSSVWLGLQEGAFDQDIAGLVPGSTYQFDLVASNAAGLAVTDAEPFSTHPLPSTFYVATNGNNTAGTNWSTAHGDPQTAFTVAEAGDTICLAGHEFVKAGVYQEPALWTLASKSDLVVAGGHAATSDAALPGLKDPGTWPTVLHRSSGDARVLHAQGLTDCLIEGLTFRNGSINASPYGGGMYVTGATGLTLSTCAFISNGCYTIYTTPQGGALYIVGSVATVTNCLLFKNTSDGQGNASGAGGGLSLTGSRVEVMDSIIRANYANGGNGGNGSGYGGGVFAGAGALLNMRRTIAQENRAYQSRAGFYGYGGGVCVQSGATGLLANCLITRNLSTVNAGAAKAGDGVYSAGILDMGNCTVADNSSGVGVFFGGGRLSISNSIIWGHSNDLQNLPDDGGLPPVISNVFYCCTQNGDNDGVQGCISSDPLFVNTNTYHLSSKRGYYGGGYFRGGTWALGVSNSPCLDAGDPTLSAAEEPPPNGRRVNMGAYGNTAVASLSTVGLGSVFVIH